jgi:hypothetical protein
VISLRVRLAAVRLKTAPTTGLLRIALSRNNSVAIFAVDDLVTKARELAEAGFPAGRMPYLLMTRVMPPEASADPATTSLGVNPTALSLAVKAAFATTLPCKLVMPAISAAEIFVPAL